MKLGLAVVALGLVFGVAAGGRPSNLLKLRIRWAWLCPVAFAMQVVPLPRSAHVAATVLLVASYGVLLVFALANVRVLGMPLILAGIAVNLVVIALNGGMPVTRDALRASGELRSIPELAASPGRYHLARPDDVLLPLSDAMGGRTPTHYVISAGDLGIYGGGMLLVAAGMIPRRRRRLAGEADDGDAAAGDDEPLPAVEAVEADGRGDAPPERTRAVRAFEAAVSFPVAAWLLVEIVRDPRSFARPALVFWVAAIALIDLMPVTASGGMQLSLSFPIELAVAMLFAPPVACAVTLAGSFDPREMKGELPPLKLLFIRAQVAASVAVEAALFHALASVASPWFVLVPSVVVSLSAGYAVNVALVAEYVAISGRERFLKALAGMQIGSLGEFLLSYLGFSVFGIVIARFSTHDGLWSVAVFVAPLVFGRQMYFRSRALSDRLAERNELLSKQAARLQRALASEQRAVAELKELNRMKSDFVAIASHELRTPLTTIIGYAKTLRQPAFMQDVELREEFLQTMERQGDRLLRLVENLLLSANVENGQLQITPVSIPVRELLRESVEALGSRRARVRVGIGADVATVVTDRTLLLRIVANLLDNALKYSPEGTVCDLSARVRDGRLVIAVRDRGVGIAREDLARIFDRFYQADTSSTRSFPGVGLGLSLVRELVRALNGRIDVRSAPGRGSVFTVAIPGAVPSEREWKPPQTSAALGRSADTSHRTQGAPAIAAASRPRTTSNGPAFSA